MNRLQVTMVAAVSAMTTTTAFGAGFALYEGSAAGTALGGTVMGKAYDGSANFYNPATLSDFTNTVVTVGFVTEHPTADTTINGHPGRKMDPGAFVLPHFHLVQPLPWDFTLGLGFAPEFGLGTHYHPGWEMEWNTRSTLVEGLTLTPNLAYNITEDWSVSAGFRLLYFSFDQTSRQYAYGPLQGHYHLKGNNNFEDWGWQVSTRYRITDTVSVGAMYKSYIDSQIKGHAHMRSGVPQIDGMASGTASAEIRLPQSVTVGANWDVTETVHLGTAVTWTEWSSMPAINFKLPTGFHPARLSWDDAFRFGFGGAWDFHENFSLLGSYVYDMDPCCTKQDTGSTMLPPGDRHIAALGISWHYKSIEVTLGYSLVFMSSESVNFTHPYTGRKQKFNTENGLSQSAGLSLTYTF